MVCVGGNCYSVPNTTRRRALDVDMLADEIRIFEDGALVVSHIPLEGRNQKRFIARLCRQGTDGEVDSEHGIRRTGDQVAPAIRSTSMTPSACSLGR